MKKKGLRILSFLMMCILMFNFNALAVSSGSKTFNSDNGDIQLISTEVDSKNNSVELNINYNDTEFLVTLQQENGRVSVMNLNNKQEDEFQVNEWNDSEKEVYLINDPTSEDLDTDNMTQIDLESTSEENMSRLQSGSPIDGILLGKDVIKLLLASGMVFCIGKIFYIIASEGAKSLDRTSYQYWFAKIKNDDVYIGPGISQRTAANQLFNYKNVWAASGSVAIAACIQGSYNGKYDGPEIHGNGDPGYYIHYHPWVFNEYTGKQEHGGHCFYGIG